MSRKNLPQTRYLILLLVIVFAFYLYTRAPSILYIDAGTHIAAMYTLGNSNPPGFPLYLLIGHFFTKLPVADILFRVQLLSILSSLGVLTLVYLLIQRILSANFFFVKSGTNDPSIKLFKNKIFALSTKALVKTGVLPTNLINIISLAATLALAFSYQFWSQSINTESYILTNLAMMALLTLAITVPEKGKISVRRFLAGAVILGLASGLNPTIVQTIPALGIAAIFLWKRIEIPRLIIALSIVLVLTAAIYSYLPLRAQTYPFTNWGNPQTWDLFWGHIRGEGLDIYDPRTNSINGFTGAPEIMARSIGRYFYLTFLQFTPILVPLILLGMYYMFQKNWRLFLVLITIPITNLIFGALYLSGNQESWFIASYVIFSIFLAAGLNFVVKILLASPSKLFKRSGVILVALLIPLIPLLWWFTKLDRSNHVATSEYANNLYNNIPPNSVVIGSGDFFNSMTHYEYSVQGRKGVFPVTANMWYILPWYRDTLRHHRPDLVPQELGKMIKMDRIEEYNQVMNWWIEWLLDRNVQVFITPLVFRETVIAGTDAGKYKINEERLKGLPHGLTTEIVKANSPRMPDETNFNYAFSDPEFYKNKPFYLENNYHHGFNIILQDYAFSFSLMATYFIEQGDIDKAEEFLLRAYRIAPNSPEIVNRLGVFYVISKNDGGLALDYFQEALLLKDDALDIRLNFANALTSAKQFEEAKRHFQYVAEQAETQELYNQATEGLARVVKAELAQVAIGWNIFDDRRDGYVLKYPPDWTVEKSSTNGVVVIQNPAKNFQISLFSIKKEFQNQENFAKESPLSIKGEIIQQGPAQIPGFEASVTIWIREDKQNVIEFVLQKEDRYLHVTAEPFQVDKMRTFDEIISTLQFLK